MKKIVLCLLLGGVCGGVIALFIAMPEFFGMLVGPDLGCRLNLRYYKVSAQ